MITALNTAGRKNDRKGNGGTVLSVSFFYVRVPAVKVFCKKCKIVV